MLKKDELTDVKKKTNQESTKKEDLVYCGPTIKGVVVQNSHFNNGLPKKLAEYLSANNQVKRLIVPIEKFIETTRNIKIKGTIEYITYTNILNQRGE